MQSKVNVEHTAFLATHLSSQREKGKYCDVCICVDEKRFLAHKCILSANCSKLDSLIMDAIGQSSSNHDIEIEIQGVSSVGFKTLLEYFYIGVLNLKSDTVMSVWMTAAYLELPDVVKLCNDFCQQSVMCVSTVAEDISKVSESSSSVTLTSEMSTSEEPIEVNIVTTAPLSDSDTSAVELTTDEGSATILTSLQNATVGGADSSIEKTREKQSVSDHDHRNESLGSNSLPPSCDASAVVTSGSDTVNDSMSRMGWTQSGCKDMMVEVEQLRIQHEKLQRLQQQQQKAALFSSPHSPLDGSPAKKKVKRRRISTSLALLKAGLPSGSSSTSSKEQITAIFPRSGQSQPFEFKIISESYKKQLYVKYSITPETTIASTCSAEELLYKGKARSRKSTEQNALNNTIRMILDTMRIVDSTDPAVEDALILIMDRFDTLRLCINNPTIRRNLLMKIRHSIHCKKWRMKKLLVKLENSDVPMRPVKQEVNEDNLHG